MTGLALGDWRNRGLTREATAVSKGSHGRRVKFFRFSADTATLLRRYFDGDRRLHDPKNWRLADYLCAADAKLVDLNDVPLFLSTRGTPLNAKSFRETYWAPACRAVGLDADPHQARHWYVTMAVRTIHETSTTEAEIRRRIRELVEYMQWRGGEQTMVSYDHYFDSARHADIQDQLHERLRVALEQGLKRGSSHAALLRCGAQAAADGRSRPGASPRARWRPCLNPRGIALPVSSIRWCWSRREPQLTRRVQKASLRSIHAL